MLVLKEVGGFERVLIISGEQGVNWLRVKGAWMPPDERWHDIPDPEELRDFLTISGSEASTLVQEARASSTGLPSAANVALNASS